MSLESVTTFAPEGPLPVGGRGAPFRLAAGLSRGLGRGLRAFLGRDEEPLLLAQPTGNSGPVDPAAALRAVLGPDARLESRAEERPTGRGPLLLVVRVAMVHGDRCPIPAGHGAALVDHVRRSGAPVLPVLARPAPDGGFRAVAGAPIAAERLARLTDDGELLRLLEARTGLLRHRPSCVAPPPGPGLGLVPVSEPVGADLVEREIGALPSEQRLVESGRFVVVQARAHQIPVCVREVGRLRELAFRAVGEGTGRALDLDACDRSYRHLLLFDREARCIAGAYRFAPTDEIVPVFGVQGLYTSTLFRIEPELFEHLGPALELGRSFLRPEYQKGYAPLLLLWRGLCAYIASNPRYRTLFGAVSVAATYAPFSRELIATALGMPPALHPLAGHVSPRNPLHARSAVRRELRRLPALLEDASELSAVVSDVEPDGKGLPVLLREYLKLGGRLLGWSVDPAFGSVLDGLIAVDLPRAEGRLLALYMGRETARAYRAHHGCVDAFRAA